MLYFTRWKALAIILTALFICLFAVPNFLPEKMVASWPKWAQRHVVLGLDLQGGSHILLEVDTKWCARNAGDAARRHAPRAARARIGYTGLVVRGTARKSHSRGRQCDQALEKLRTLSQPLGGILSATGQRSLDVTSEAGGLIRLTLSEPAIVERVRQSVDQSIQIIERRVNELGTVEPLIQREGTDRILVQVPGLQDPTRLKQLLGKTAKLDFRMVDTGNSVEQATQGQVPRMTTCCTARASRKRLIWSKSACWYRAPISPTRSPALTSVPASRSSRFASILRGRANSPK